MDRGAEITHAQAVEEAKRFDVVIAKPKTYAPYVADMRAANPKLVLLAYYNGTFVSANEGDTYPESWYVRDADGNKVQSVRWDNYMMDPSNPGWVDDRKRACEQLLLSSGYDGCGLDVLGTTPVTDGSFVTARPINASTGQPWTPAEWLDATTKLGAAVGDYVARPVYGNGVGNGPRYFEPAYPSRQLLTGLDGAMAEGFLRSGRSPLDVYPTVAEWKAHVDMLVDAGSLGGRLVVVTKAWNTGTAAQKDELHKFALATFLLGNDGSSRFSFQYEEGDNPAAGHPWWNTRLGAPTGGYTAKSNGVYQRNFERGRVLVNPTTNTVKVSLGATFTALGGARVTSLTLAPHSGEVLTTG